MGGFDENLSAGEDTDLNRRLVENGYEVVIDPVLSIVHLGYPNTILSFVKRQIWHSEDCYQRLPGALNDKVFMITQLYLLGLGFLCISMVMPTTPYIGFSIVCACPAILTIKRLLRYEIYAPTIRKLVFAYVIDHLYLIGRVLGAARAIKKVLFKLVQRKYERR